MDINKSEHIAAHVASVKALGPGGGTVTVYVDADLADGVADVTAGEAESVSVPALDAEGRQVRVVFRREPFVQGGDD